MNDRGQTTQDYAVGISILLLTLIGVFFFVPAVFQPITEPVERNSQTQAQELADSIIEQYGVGGTTNTLDYQALVSTKQPQELPAGLKGQAGIQGANANVTIVDQRLRQDVYPSRTFSTGSWVYNDTTAATVTRIVRFQNESRCGADGACRMVVRVWN